MTGEKKAFAYTCSYIPVEIIHASGYLPVRIAGDNSRCCAAEETGLSRNLCPYSHAILKTLTEAGENLAGIVIADSCDAMKKLYDVLYLQEFKNVHLLSVPRKDEALGIEYYARQLKSLYQHLVGETSSLLQSITLYQQVRAQLEKIRRQGVFRNYSQFFQFKREILSVDPEKALTVLRGIKSNGRAPGGIPVVLTGSPMPNEEIFLLIEEAGFSIFLNDSCLDNRWDGLMEGKEIEDPYLYLSRLYLEKTPCARMARRKDDIEALEKLYPEKVRGFIHFRMPFCDLYGFDLVQLLGSLGTSRVLSLETDGSKKNDGQLRTRIKAFAEMIQKTDKRSIKQSEGSGKYYCGIDIGSTTVDGVLLSGDGEIISYRIIKTGPGADKAAYQLYQDLLKEASITPEEVAYITATGYGRESISFADGNVTEISCHAKGVLHIYPDARFIIDIGGQDSKVIKIDGSGKVENFQMNDKCAAGTGRFLEVMAQALEIDFFGMSSASYEKGEGVPISSVCTVFAESEVISLLGKGYTTPAIVKGIYNSITNRIEGMARRAGISGPVVMTGGGALNEGLVRNLEKRMGIVLNRMDVPQIAGAIGAALYGLEADGDRL